MRPLLLMLLITAPLGAQTSRDTAHAKTVRAAVDTIRRTYPGTLRNTPTLRRMVDRIAAAESVLIYTPPIVVTPAPPPPAPSASFAVSCAILTCAFNAGASTGARLTYSWDCGALPNCAPGSVSAFTFIYPHEGGRTTTLIVRDSLGRVATASRTFTVPGAGIDTTTPPPPPPVDTVVPPPPADTGTGITMPAAPVEIPNPVFGASTRPLLVSSVMLLQPVLDAAVTGDSIVLANDGSWVGNFRLPASSCTGVGIKIVAAGTALAKGVRRGAIGGPKLTTPNNQPALATVNLTGHTCNVLIDGLEFTGTLVSTSIQYGIVTLGDGGWAGGGETQTSLDRVPENIVLSHVWIHGSQTLNSTRCLAINARRVVLRDSRIDECHAKGFDSQAIEGWNGSQLVLIDNNFVAGAGENIMLGGADPAAQSLIPSDWTITRNHVWKDPAWKGVWTVKNLLELKDARRVRIEANVFENNWADAQSGMAIVFKSSTDVCGTGCMWEGTTDVIFRRNIIRKSHRGINVQGYDNSYVPTGTDVHVARVLIEENLAVDIGTSNGVPPTDGWLLLITHDPKDILIRNNTIAGNTPGYGLALYMAYGSGGQMRNLRIKDNVLAGQGYLGIFADGGKIGTAALTDQAGASWTWSGNVVADVDLDYQALHPAGNTYLDSYAQVGFTAAWTTPYAGKGADIAALTLATAGVVVTP